MCFSILGFGTPSRSLISPLKNVELLRYSGDILGHDQPTILYDIWVCLNLKLGPFPPSGHLNNENNN
jgi:hypothetical protein